MTNTVYFHNTIRDDVSTTTEEASPTSDSYTPSPQQGNQSTISVKHNITTDEASPTSDIYTNQPGSSSVNPDDDNNDDQGGIFRFLLRYNSLIPGFILTQRSSPTQTITVDGETPFTSNRYTHQQQGPSSVNPGTGGILEYSNLKEFSFNELESATRNFHLSVLLDGPSGNWRVFKGWIDENKLTATKPEEGIVVAIKRLDKYLINGREFGAEVNYLGRLYHPNLVKLLGYCSDNEERLLVHEFMPRGSLADHLFESHYTSTPLSWSVRMKIALGAAKGLAFLHSTPINVIHGNFKSSIILLEMDYNAKLSCFGLVMKGPTGDKRHISSRVLEYGYASPEYWATGHLTVKCDVYTFGVVLLEMLSGRRILDTNRPSGEHYLVEWAKPYLTYKRKVYRVADSRLEGQYSLEGFQKAANLALICLSRNAKSRPNMDEVVKVLGEL